MADVNLDQLRLTVPFPRLVRFVLDWTEQHDDTPLSGLACCEGLVRSDADRLRRLADRIDAVAVGRKPLLSGEKDFEAWRAKYYPVPADEVPREQAARATLRQWRGLTPGVLTEYGMEKVPYKKEVLVCGSDTCPLCHAYKHCGSCLFVEANAGRSCECNDGVYDHWRRTGDAGPMIAALEKAAKLEEERYGKS